MTSFDSDTALEVRGPGLYEGRIERRWWVDRGPNGGYLAAIVLRALALTVGDPERAPRSLAVHYAAVPEEGPVRVECVVERAGRSVATLSARVLQGERLVALALAAFSKSWPGAEYADAVMPDVPAPESLDALAAGPLRPPFLSNFDMRWAVGGPPLSGSGSARAGGWLRPIEPRPADALLVAALTDAWAPSPFSRLSAPAAAPTIDLTIHFRSPLPPPGARDDDFYLGVFHSRTAADGFFEEDGEIWTRDGLLLAQSRQLALLLPAP